MSRHQQTAARQLDLDSSTPSSQLGSALVRAHGASRPVPLCVVCGRKPAHLTLARQHGHAPARLCLRCHHAVMRHRKMLRSDLSSVDQSAGGSHPGRTHHFAGDAGLTVPRGERLSANARDAALVHRRRRAQVAARRALDLLDCG